MIGTSLRAFAVRVFAAIVGGRAFLLVLVFVFTASTQAIAQALTGPDITSEGPFLVDEGETVVATLTADDNDTATTDLIWTNTGGADSGKFSLTSAGVLTFSSVKDYETPDDADTDRTYEVTVQVSDGTDSDMAELLVTLLNVTELTAITGPSSVAFPENSWSRVATFTASSEEDRAGIEWILGGTDRDHFSIDNPPGALRFALQAVAPRIFSEPPDFEAPVDPDAANTYELTLLAEAGSSVTDTHTFTVTVTDVDEEGALSLSSTRPALGTVLTAVPTDPDGVTAGTALWQWERSTGRNSWAVIDGAAAASYTPVAADTNTFLRVTATYDDQHGTGKTVSEVAPNVVTGLLLTGLTAETDDSQADTARGLYPAFDPQTLHYGIGCNGTDTLVLTVSAPANARVAVAGVQAASAPEVVSVAVTADSDVAIRVTDASGAGTTYVVHCLSNVFFEIETVTYPGTDLLEDLILFNRSGYFTLMDRNGVPRLRRAYSGLGGFAIRFYRIGIDGAYRYGFGNTSSFTVLDEDFEVVEDNVRTVAPLTVLNAHDFQILEDGNYLVMSWEPATPDFSDIDLPYLDGADVSSVDVLDSAFQIVTPGGQAVFTWNSWGNMAIEDCVHHRFPVTLSTDPDMRSPGGGYAHINGMHVVDGVLVASMRGCSKVLGIDVKPGDTRGDVLWRMGRTNLSDSEWAARDIGPRPLDFINDPEGEFCGQHTARFLPNGNVFLFDNGVLCAIDPWTFEELGREGYDFSRAVEYALDLDNHEAVFVRDHSLRGERSHIGYANGNVDVLDNGDWLVSWGRVLAADDRFPDNEMATLVDPATGQEKLGLRFRELPSDARQRRITATVAPAEALAPQPVSLTAEFPASDHTSLVHTGAGDASQVIVSFNQPVVDFSASSPSISVQGATIESVLSHIVAGEPANAYVVTLTPAGASDITVRLVADQPCADGGICTAGETLLSEVPASHVIRADTTPPTVSKIEVSSNPGSDRFYIPGDEIQATVTFSETVWVTGMPQFTLKVGGADRTADYQGGSGTAALVFGYEVDEGDEDADGVSIEANRLTLNGGTIRDGAGHNAVLEHEAVTPQASHKVDGVNPELAATGGAVVNGTTLTLTYDEVLDGGSRPETEDFTVTGGDHARTVTGVRVSGSAVELTLDVGAEHLEAGILVSYTPGANPIQDVPGNDAEALSRDPVTNDTPDTTSPTVRSLAITSSSGSDQTYAAEDEIELTVTFSETVEVEGTPQLRLRVGSRTRTAGYLRGTDTAALVFGYEVADGDEDTDGVSIEAGRIALNGGTIRDGSNNNAVLDHEEVAADSGHKVDAVKPQLAATDGAVVDGTRLTLTYDEALDPNSRPAASDFTVSGGNSARTVSNVAVSGQAVTLTLNSAVEHGETGIRVSYRPGTNPIQDAAGNDALGLSNERVTNNTGDTTAPTVSRVEITSRPERAATYAAGQEIAVTVTFSETVVVTGTPQLRLNVGGVSRTAAYRSGTGAAAVFVYMVADGESDTDGVSIDANSLTLNGGRIRDGANNNALLTHDGLAANAGHKVDGVKPALAANGGAVVNGTTLTLTFGERLDGSSTPQASAFTVTGGDTSRTVTDVALSGSAVLLTVDPAVEHGETGIRVSYTVPTGTGSIPLQDVLGNDADRLSNVPVTNETPDTTSPTVSKLEITSDPGTDRTYAAGDEIRVTVTFSEPVDVERTPRLMLKVGDRNRPAGYLEGTGTTELVFGYEVADGDEDTDGVSVEAGRLTLNGGTIRDGSNNNAVLDHDGLAANSGHKVDGAGPDLAETGGAVVNGTTLTLTYDEALDGGSRPVSGDFTVSGGDRVRAVTGVRVNGSGVELTLDVGAEHGEAGILVSYTVPTGMGANPIRDVPGNDAEALSRESVTNETPDTTSPEVSILAISSNPGFDRTYAAGDEIEVTVTFSETVEVEGTPQLRLRVGSRTRTAGYLRGTDTAALVFGYEVADGDEDTDGVSIEAGRIALNGGTIKDEADNNAVRVHGSVATQAGHKVDGVRPAFVSAAVDGASLTLTYGEALDGGSRPAPGDFTVEVDGAGRSVSGVSVSGSVVILTLNPAVEHGDTGIRVSYTPGTNPLRDAVGNDALGLSNRSVTNTTGAPNTAPQITSPSSFDVPENQAMVRRLAARDTDPGDEVTGWAIVGGTDRGQFAITSDTGDLSFRTAPDFEAPGDNAYEVTVEVRSGAGARELEAEQTFTLRVTDEREPPGIPEAPTFSGETADSLTVNWSEPDNTGPAITDYDVQYREKGTGGFIDGQHEGPGLSLRLDDLEPGTVYEVQLRATNDEGTGNWSESEEGMTVTPLTVQMTSDLPPPVEGPFTVRFSYSEPVTGFSSNDIESGQNPACSDDQNNPVFCDPGIGRLDTVDNRVFTATVTPGTNGVAHNYTLTLTVSGGAVRSSAGNKPNEAATLEVRIAPPGVTAPISTIGLRASPGNGQVTLRWNTPANTGGAPIVRYEYRWKESGGEFSDWISVGSGTRSATVRNLTNGAEYTFEARAVNALGKGSAETAVATPTVVTRPPVTGGGGGGGGSGRGRPPSYPGTIQAEGGDGEATLRWDAPSSQGSSRIQHYEYRIDGEGEWISTGSSDRIHTIAGLINGRIYLFHLRAVSAAGAGSHRISPEATPGADLDFTHFANGGFITSTLVLVNAGAYPVRPAIYFYDQDGDPIEARRVVELTPELEVRDDGALSPRTVMNPLSELTIATHGRGGQRVGSVTVRAASSIGGVLRFDIPGFGVAGVGDSPTLRDALVPVRRQEGGINTGVAVRNRGTATLTLQCRLMRDGAVLEEADIRLEVNGQDSRFIDQVFATADTSDFAGSVRCAAPEPGRFSAVAFELDGVNRIFTTLPVVSVPAVPEQEQEEELEQEQQQDATRLDFTHFANGGGIVSELVLVNPGANSVRPAIYFHDQDGGAIAAEAMLDVPADMEIGDDGALRPGTAMNPLGELTISTHGRGVLKVGSVAVVAEGPVGGVLRFDIPGLGVAGVGDSPQVRDALVPVRRQDGGVNTGVAVHNRGATALLVRCRLMRAGAVLEETIIPLAANGQDSRFIDQVFPTADTSDFAGSVRCLTPEPGLFSAVAFELDGVNRIFTTLPVVPVVEVP